MTYMIALDQSLNLSDDECSKLIGLNETTRKDKIIEQSMKMVTDYHGCDYDVEGHQEEFDDAVFAYHEELLKYMIRQTNPKDIDDVLDKI